MRGKYTVNASTRLSSGGRRSACPYVLLCPLFLFYIDYPKDNGDAHRGLFDRKHDNDCSALQSQEKI